MKIIKVINGKWKIPKKFRLSKKKRKIAIKTPWCSQVEYLLKGDFQTSLHIWFRSKEKGNKPYIPEGFVEIDGERFKAKEVKEQKK